MKRFYKTVTIGPDRGILLDGRSVRTPSRAVLALPTDALAVAVAAEWEAQGDAIDPRSMTLTGLSNAAIDVVAADPASFAADLARYGETDMLCYRAEEPAALVARQAERWDPLLDWARGRYDIHFETATGVIHRAQPEATVRRLGEAVASREAFALVGLSPLVTIGGSLVTALALAEGAIDLDTAWAAVQLEDEWQAEQWGEDELATRATEARRADFAAAARFLSLLDR